MSIANDSENKPALPAIKAPPSEKYVIAIVVAILLALGVHQLFFCPTCYTMADRTAVPTSIEP